MTYDNRIEIRIFPNPNKKTEKSPDVTGVVEFPDGTKYDVSLWNKVSKSGSPYKSGWLKLPETNPAPRQRQSQVEVDF